MKLLKGQNSISGAEEDRISSLPDSLIYHILSFLNIKWVARTSLLSKRWSRIWTSVPTLDFEISNFPDSSEIIKFMDFVDRTLLLHDFSYLKKFSLRWLQRSDQNLLNVSNKINSWISAVIRHNVEEISLLLYQHVPSSIPLSLFTSESLLTLELDLTPNICLPKYISFPRLNRLKLCDVKFSDECSNEQLFSSCPVLEDLILRHCTFHMRSFCISISTLKFLKLKSSYEKDDCLRDCSLKIHAPSLVSLTCRSSVPKEFILSAFPTLVEAEVEFLVDEYYVPTREQRIDHAGAISRFLQALSHVKRLSISAETLQALFLADNLFNNLPTFHNVKQLTITEEVDADEILIAVLKATPNLESLVFDRLITPRYGEEDKECYSGNNDPASDVYCVGDYEDEDKHNNEDSNFITFEGEQNHARKDDGWKIDMVHTGCLFQHLKSVFFQQFIGKPREMRWVKLMLKNAKPLRTMIVSYGTDTAFCFSNPKSKEQLMVEILRQKKTHGRDTKFSKSLFEL